MKGDVRVAPNGGVIIHKRPVDEGVVRAFSTGTGVMRRAAGFVGGFALAQAIPRTNISATRSTVRSRSRGSRSLASMLAGFFASRRRWPATHRTSLVTGVRG